jgi:flagellar protein FliL
MTKPGFRSSDAFLSLCLVIVAAALALFIAIGTVWGFASGRARPGANRKPAERSLFVGGKRNPSPEEVAAREGSGKTAIFADIGILRAATADSKPVTIVVSPFLPYPADDVPLSEELVSKNRANRAAITGWFRAHTLKEISRLGEEGVKRELLELVNANLVLGKLQAIYFEEYMVIE